MRDLFERLIAALPMHPRCRRALDETLADWKHEDETIDNRVQRWLCDLRSAASVLRAPVMMSWWSPRTPLSQPLRMAGTSARDEIIDLINNLSPDSSYEDILREVAARRVKAGGEPAREPTPDRPRPSWGRMVFPPHAWRVAVLFLVLSAVGGLLQVYTTEPMYQSTAHVRVGPDRLTPLGPGIQQDPGPVDMGFFVRTEMGVLTSRQLKRDVVRKLRLDRNPELTSGQPASSSSTGNSAEHETPAETAAADTIAANLSVSVTQLSSLFSISYIAASPATAALVANAIADEYVGQNLQKRRADIHGRLSKLGEFMKHLSADIDANQRNLITRTTEANVLDQTAIPYQQLRLRLLNDQKTLENMTQQRRDLEILAQGVTNNVSMVEHAQPAARCRHSCKTA